MIPASPEAIRAAAWEILSDPRFAPRRSLWQWFIDKLQAWGGPNVQISDAWGQVLLWGLVIWCVLALLAILAHLVWTLWVLFGSDRPLGKARSGATHHEALHHLSPEELLIMMQRLADGGSYREALGVMMVALLRWLDRAGTLVFHHSKTNGEHLRDYPQDAPGRAAFRSFVMGFEGSIYGGAPCEAEQYRELNLLFEQIRSHAGQRS